MNIEPQKLYWNGKYVGEILESNFDNYDFYGKWNATDDASLYAEFLEEVDKEGGAAVSVGEKDSLLRGTVEIEPDEQIEIKLRA